jgi:hypothetical protein
MSTRGRWLTIVVLLAAWAIPVGAQQRLRDLVAQGGYDWIIGRWVGYTDGGEAIEFKYDWLLDRHAVLAETTMGDFKHRSIVMFSPARLEVTDLGADNRGGLWTGTWDEDAAGLVQRVEHTNPEGKLNKGEIVHSRVDANTITIAIYAVDAAGARSVEPWAKVTCRRKPVTSSSDVSAATATGRSADSQTLSDLVSEGGYDWLIGRWVATNEGRTYELEHKAILDGCAGLVNVKIGDFQYQGLITYAPAREEIMQVGADTMGGTWKGTWEEGGEGLTHRVDVTRADGAVQKAQLVYIKVDNDTFKAKEYAIENGQPTLRGELTFKRRKP